MSIQAPNIKDQVFQQSIEGLLARVEVALHSQLTSSVRTVTDVSNHLLDSGGKRLRPSLVLLSAQTCGITADVDALIDVAASTELIHMATLMHDDVIDGSDSRRGRITANAFWGNQISILTGDYVLTKAVTLLARHGDMRILEALSDATSAMVEGEISQMESRGDTQALTASYLYIIQNKTAEFISACCKIGSIVAGALDEEESALGSYGLNLGIAFQITDDLLDLMGDVARTGKPVGGDIREGKITMPIILALDKANSTERARLEAIIHDENTTEADIEFVRNLAESTGAIEGSRQAAARYVDLAIENLSPFPESNSRDLLVELVQSVLHRKS